MGTLADGRLCDVSEVAGGPGESAVAPRWLGEELIFVSDRTDWWNLYLWSDGSIRALHEPTPSSAFRSGSSARRRTRSSTMINCCAP